MIMEYEWTGKERCAKCKTRITEDMPFEESETVGCYWFCRKCHNAFLKWLDEDNIPNWINDHKPLLEQQKE